MAEHTQHPEWVDLRPGESFGDWFSRRSGESLERWTQDALNQLPVVEEKDIEGFDFEQARAEYGRCLRLQQELSVLYANTLLQRSQIDSEMDNHRGRDLMRRLPHLSKREQGKAITEHMRFHDSGIINYRVKERLEETIRQLIRYLARLKDQCIRLKPR